MGGCGSGRQWYYNPKSEVEDCYALAINSTTREGIFDGGGWGNRQPLDRLTILLNPEESPVRREAARLRLAPPR